MSISKKTKKYEDWLSNLSELDRVNFITLVNLPNAGKLIDKMVESNKHGLYVEMATFALGIKQAIESSTRTKTK